MSEGAEPDAPEEAVDADDGPELLDEEDLNTEETAGEDPDSEEEQEPGLIESLGLLVVGFVRGLWGRAIVGKQTAATLVGRHAGDSDDPSRITDEDPDEREERLRERAESMADFIEGTLGVVLRQFVDLFRVFGFMLASLVMRPIPRSGALADSLIEKGVNLKKNATGADALGFSMYGDRKVVPQAAHWDSEETKYVTTNGEDYSAKAEGHTPYRLFGVDVFFTLRESAEVLDPIQAYCAAQREIGDWAAWVRESDDKRQIVLGADPPDGTDGVVLDFNKVWEQYYQKITQEDLERQNKIGRLAELDDEAKTRVVLMVLGAFVGGMLAVIIILWALNNVIADSSGTISLFLGGGFL